MNSQSGFLITNNISIQLPWSSWGDISMKTKKDTHYTKVSYPGSILIVLLSSSSLFPSKLLYHSRFSRIWRGALSLIVYKKISFKKCWLQQSRGASWRKHMERWGGVTISNHNEIFMGSSRTNKTPHTSALVDTMLNQKKSLRKVVGTLSGTSVWMSQWKRRLLSFSCLSSLQMLLNFNCKYWSSWSWKRWWYFASDKKKNGKCCWIHHDFCNNLFLFTWR